MWAMFLVQISRKVRVGAKRAPPSVSPSFRVHFRYIYGLILVWFLGEFLLAGWSEVGYGFPLSRENGKRIGEGLKESWAEEPDGVPFSMKRNIPPYWTYPSGGIFLG